MSDPGAVTAEPDTGDGGAVGGVGGAVFGEAGLPDHEQKRLARLGYVQINARGHFAGHKYAASDEIASVTRDEVRLTLRTEELVG